jgi:hypothetical protein
MKPLDLDNIHEIRFAISYGSLKTHWTTRLELWTRPANHSIMAQIDDHLNYPL